MVILLIHFGFGGNFKDIKLGILNEEVPKYNNCLNESFVTISLHDFKCNLNKISCKFISSINSSSITKVILPYFYVKFILTLVSRYFMTPMTKRTR